MTYIRSIAAAIAFLATPALAQAQSGCPSIAHGAVLTAAQWQACFSAKQDTIPYVTVNKAGDTMLGRLTTVPSTTLASGFNVAPGAPPTSPNNGDIWTTSSGLFVRINGSTIGPITSSLSTTLASARIYVGNGSNIATPVPLSGDASLTNTGAITVTKTGGVNFGPFATGTDAADLTGVVPSLTVLAPSTLSTTTVLSNAPIYANGSSGVGATLTASGNGALVVDSTAANVNDIVLVQNQASAVQNGIYTVTAAGDVSNPYVLTRVTYFDSAAEMLAGSYTLVTSGSTLQNNAYVLQSTIATVGTTPVVFNAYILGASFATTTYVGNSILGATQINNTYYASCDISGVVDCSSTIASIITAANAGRGAKIILPCGNILMNSGVTFSKGGIEVTGCSESGWEDYTGYHGQIGPPTALSGQQGTQGTYIIQTSNANPVFTINNTANHVAINNMAYTPDVGVDSDWAGPILPSGKNYKPFIFHSGNGSPASNGGSLQSKNILCLMAYDCVVLGQTGKNVGFTDIERLGCVASHTCISVVNSVDSVRVTRSHMWNGFINNYTNMRAYVQANANAVLVYRSDNLYFSGNLSLGFFHAMLFDSSADGYANDFQIISNDFDGNNIPIQFNGGGGGGSVVDLRTNSNNAAGSIGILVTGNNMIVDFSNMLIGATNGPAIAVPGTGNSLAFTNITALDCQKGTPGAAITAVSTNTIITTGALRLAGLGCTSKTSGAANFLGVSYP